ncbi:hypothetical protein CPB83DRAFT_894046 [Crepidotus variabilis]|uniref:Uncharacterized protein n=1 Tax=Crepidotus variabilis TaxID=179855 RepID=A0A9P6EFW6_9AGAR|nr:hypothetical protein CPB83DRAFT_894046 [Crepidotus variabilis]
MDTEKALQAKETGNKLLKEGKIAESIKHYQEAVKFDPQNPVYLANLSAALLSTRLAKTLSHGLRSGAIPPSDIEQNIEAIRTMENQRSKDAFENVQSWKLWSATRSNLALCAELALEDRIRLSKMPIFKSAPDPRLTYFTFGMDDIISLFCGWGPKFEDPIHLRSLSKEQFSQLAFLFGGAADSRHVYGTIIDLGSAHSKLPANQKKHVKVHMTTKTGKKDLVDFVLKANLDKALQWGLVWESKWYQDVNVFIPHGRLVEEGKHPGFDYYKEFATKKGPHKAKTSQIAATVRKSWKPNITTFDDQHKGYLEIALDDLAFVAQIAEFNDSRGLKINNPRAKREWPAFAYIMTFFSAVVDTIKNLKSQIKVEILCGEITSELTKMRLGTDRTRPAGFPRNFTRMWDYTHGTLSTALYMVPALQDNMPSAVTANCLFNTYVWKDDDEFCFNYTMLLPQDLERYLGTHTINKRALMDILTLSSTTVPRSLTSLVSRDELHAWLGRLLLSIISPGRSKPRPDLVKVPFNLVAFIQLLVELNWIGYPGQWLGDFLQAILNGTLQTNPDTYKGHPLRPVSGLNKITAPHRVRLDPWFAGLETILASTKHALLFAIQLPENFAATMPEDIGQF